MDALDKRKGEYRNVWGVSPGDVWGVGSHIIACGDIENGDAKKLLDRLGEVPELTYVDPPWGPALATGYRTKAGVPRKVDYWGLIDQILEIVSVTRNDVFIEQGQRWTGKLKERVEASGGCVLGEWDVTYFRRLQSKLIRVRWGSSVAENLVDFTGMDDDDTPEAAIRNYSGEGATIFDCCTGQGATAVAAENAGRKFVGLELHPGRISEALSKFFRLGYVPRKLGTL